MRYIRTNGVSMLDALRTIATPLDACWWYLGGNGFSITETFLERLRPRQWSEERVREHWMRLLTDYVEHDTEVGRVGKPGFFRRLGDSVDFHWTCHFAVEGKELPMPSLKAVAEVDRISFGPFETLPADVLLAARDIDGAYQEYGFRDEWMFRTVLGDLRGRRRHVEEVTDWPHVGGR